MLTIKKIESLKPKDKPYRVSDGNNLYIYIPKTGVKTWQMRYIINGKERIFSLGKYINVSLSEAREKVLELQKQLSKGIDIANKKTKEKKNEYTFKEIFKEWYKFKSNSWSEKYAKEIDSMFSQDILPIIGCSAINNVDPLDIIKVMRVFEARGAMERASKARRRCGEVFKYAIISGRAKYNPAPDLVGAETGYNQANFPFLSIDQISTFNHDLEKYKGSVTSKLATKFLQYTALRTKEMRFLEWVNVDLDRKTITIPSDIMKMRKEHIVPLSNQTIEIIKKLEPISKNISNYVFCGRNNHSKPISDGAVLSVIRQIGWSGVASGHGFRHQFSTILNEHGFDPDLIERQLAHIDRNSIRGVYNHAQYLEKRSIMMQWYADYIDKLCGK